MRPLRLGTPDDNPDNCNTLAYMEAFVDLPCGCAITKNSLFILNKLCKLNIVVTNMIEPWEMSVIGGSSSFTSGGYRYSRRGWVVEKQERS